MSSVALSLPPLEPEPALALVPAPERSMPLFVMDQELECLLDTFEMIDPSDQELQAELALKIAKLQDEMADKVDAICSVLSICEWHISGAKAEKLRLDGIIGRYAARIERIKKYVLPVLDRLPQPKRGPKKMEGRIHVLKLTSSEVCEITDADKVPIQYKTVTAEMPAELWESIAQNLFAEDLEKIKVSVNVRKVDVKRDLKANVLIDGADLVWNKGVAAA